MALRTKHIALSARFPYLQKEICLLTDMDSEFRQLIDDYELLVQSLTDRQVDSEQDLEEIIALKASLELEALEKLSLVQAGQ